MNKLYFIIGASGTGKTTAVRMLEARKPEGLAFCYSDDIPVPSFEEMRDKYGSVENWQQAKTEIWVSDIKQRLIPNSSVVFDGQSRQSFIIEACAKNQIENYEIILFDCSDNVREDRLVNRGNPELVNQDMMNWAKYLREESKKRGDIIIDTSNFKIGEAADRLAEQIK